MTIVGVGFDDPATNRAWSEDGGFTFELWTDDDDRTLALTYGAAASASQRYPSRITVVLDADGELVLEYLEDINVGAHPREVLDDCTLLFGP